MQLHLFPIYEALVIIDMQLDFQSSYDKRLQVSCIREIKRAKRRGIPIILLEYEGCGNTHQSLMDAIGAYKLLQVVRKNTDSGAKEVQFALNYRHWQTVDHLKICGVNAHACVLGTVMGLKHSKKYEQIFAVLDAIGDTWGTPNHVFNIVQSYGVPIVLSHPRSYMRKYMV